jgi:WD40 repeat protein
MRAPCIFFLILLLGGLALVSPVLVLVATAIIAALVIWGAIIDRRDEAQRRAEVRGLVFSPTGLGLLGAIVVCGLLFGFKNLVVVLVAALLLVVAVLLWRAISKRSSTNESQRQRHPDAPAIPWDRVYRHEASPDSRYVAAVAHENVYVWDMDSQRFAHSLVLDDQALSVAFSPDGRMLAIGTPDNIFIHEVPSGRLRMRIEAEDDWHAELAFSSDGRYLASANDDYPPLSLWDLHTGRRILRCDEGDGFANLGFGAFGKEFFATANPYSRDRNVVLRWQLKDDKTIRLQSL